VDCPETQELLDAYLDGELDAAGTLDVGRHLAACPSCADSFAGLQRLQAALRSAALRHPTPPRLGGRVRAALRLEVAPRRRLVVAALAGAAAAALVLATAGLWPRRGADPLAREVASAHVRSLLEGHRTDVESSDRHTVKPWFTGRLEYAPLVPDLAGAGFPLVGGRLDYLDGRPVAALVYERRRHVINLFVWPAPDASDSGPDLLAWQGYSLYNWHRGGMTWWAVSDLNAEELRGFVDEVRDHTK
jgi:anti-sigma factor RsiW